MAWKNLRVRKGFSISFHNFPTNKGDTKLIFTSITFISIWMCFYIFQQGETPSGYFDIVECVKI